MKFKIPGKTFLLGEYIALHGGPALVLAHGPSFECEFKTGKGESPFHPDSPAGIWMDIHEEIFENTAIAFTDPHNGAGGFGASTAQYLAVYLFALARQNLLRNGLGLSDMQKWAVIEDYKNLFEGEEVIPSGYDALAQLSGGLNSVRASKHNISSVEWPFAGMDLYIYKTAAKINTHDHLKNLNVAPPVLKSLETATDEALAALARNDQERFVAAVREFSTIQEKSKLVASATLELMKAWNAVPDVLWSRGCGSLGADVFAAFVRAGYEPSAEMTKSLKKVWTSRDGFTQKPSAEMSSASTGQVRA